MVANGVPPRQRVPFRRPAPPGLHVGSSTQHHQRSAGAHERDCGPGAVRADTLGMALPPGLRYTLIAATLVEVYAGASLTLAPARFIRTTYGVRGPVDAIALKFARYALRPHALRRQLG